MAALGEIPTPDYAVHADTKHEMSGTYAHAEKWTPWLVERGIKVVTVSADNTDVVKTHPNSIGIQIPAFGQGDGQIRRQCTNDWKIRPIRKFVRRLLDVPRANRVEMWMGISIDEWHRMRSADVQYLTNVYPLVDRRISRAGCISWLESKGLDIPPKSSCTFCPYHNIASWQTMKRAAGSDWASAVIVDDLIRDKCPPGAIFIHHARKPLIDAVKIPEDFGAEQLALGLDNSPETPCDSGYCFT
jgi:hypothetical protein